MDCFSLYNKWMKKSISKLDSLDVSDLKEYKFSPSKRLSLKELISNGYCSEIKLKNMEVYKLKHIPTGLFYTPSRGAGNLSVTGKVYSTKPQLKWTSTIRIKFQKWGNRKFTKRQQSLIDYFKLEQKTGLGYWSIDEYFNTKESDWEIIKLYL